MALRVVGAGLGRTGTFSQKLALERLLGAPCYHMAEVFQHPEHVPMWHAAAIGNMPDWNQLMDGYAAAVDWPASAFWEELAEENPDALILLSVRDPEKWWQSATETIFQSSEKMKEQNPEWHAFIRAMFENRFVSDLTDKDACIAAFVAHNEHVKRTAPADRLLVWEAKDGYAPICERLGIAIPEEPFPRANTKEEFIARMADRDNG